jgi:ubiquinone biosynthesis protein
LALAGNIARSGFAALGSLFSGRRRYARALAVFGEIVALYARFKLNPESNSLNDIHQASAEKVTELCRQNGAIWVKAAQFFSCRPDVLPIEYINALQVLQNEGMQVPFAAIDKALTRAWGSQWRAQFSEFSEIPVAVASIAQVHRARLTCGQEVAIKVRLPEVVRLFDQDARVFRFMAELISPFFKQLDFAQITEQLLEMTAIELDFRNEAQNLERFSRIAHPQRIRVPILRQKISNAEVLVTHWEEGERLREYLDANPERAADILTLLFGSYLQQVTRVGLYQADPHPGNFIVSPQGEVVILDFGAIGKLTPQEVSRYSKLLYGLMGFTPGVDIGQLFVDAGFVGGKAETLRDLALYVLSDRMHGENVAMAMEELIEKFRENHVRIPDTYIGIARVLITLGGLLMHYKVPFDWTPPEQRASLKARA